MKILNNLLLIVCLVFVANNALAKSTESKTLAKELAIFEPYIGTWQSEFSMGNSTVYDVAKWERALNGTTLRTLHSINNGEYGGESLIFFDKKSQQLVFYYFTTAGFYTQGTIEVIGENSFVAYEDVTGNQNGITKVKSTSTLSKDKLTVSTSYFKNGQWTKPESREYQPSSKSVQFK